jgi:putative transposase
MSRPLRIEYPGAWYHVMNRGARAQQVFLEKQDYTGFVALLKESAELWNMGLAAYCLMPTHYHLLLHSPEGNLSRFMRHVNGIYTQRFNRAHGYDGPLFRGRYKAVLIEADQYLLQLLRYIHRNPLKAGVVKRLEAYPWSSHKGYLSKGTKWAWLHKDLLLSMLTTEATQQRRRYQEFVAQEDSDEIGHLLEGKQFPSLLGGERFIAWAKERFFSETRHEEIPESKLLAPDLKQIKEAICKAYQVNEDDLLSSRRGIINEPRNVAIYLTRLLRRETLTEIGKEFHLNRYSSVSSAIKRTKVHSYQKTGNLETALSS